MKAIVYLDQELKKVCPVHGLSIGRWHDKSTWRIDYKEEATPAQRDAAAQILVMFDKASWEASQSPERTIEERLAALEAKL